MVPERLVRQSLRSLTEGLSGSSVCARIWSDLSRRSLVGS